jgi:HD-GYP domain-containing protein (c-di-GMP phosphodiesterase class II)
MTLRTAYSRKRMNRDSLVEPLPDLVRPDRCGERDEVAWLAFCERLRRALNACEWFDLRPASRVTDIVDIARRAPLTPVRSADVAVGDGNSLFFRLSDHDLTGLDVSSAAVIDAMSGTAMESTSRHHSVAATYRSTIQLLEAAIHAKDSRACEHSWRVARNSVVCGRILNLDAASLRALEAAALLHDIGKIGIDDAILQKPYELTEAEYSMIQDHPVVGAAIVQDILGCGDVGELVLHHHESYDGTGYPNGLAGDRIPWGSRIIAVADAFDSMTMGRPYRTAMTVNEAMDELTRCRGTQFCPESLHAFVAGFGRSTSGVPLQSCASELREVVAAPAA